METKVIFLYNEEEEEEVFAFFPEEIFDLRKNKTSYSHIGQHSACCDEYALESRQAEYNEYKDLEMELISLGYELDVIKKEEFFN